MDRDRKKENEEQTVLGHLKSETYTFSGATLL